ncbi:MAG: type II toxin-antitoxin system HicA family toxin [Candidatus Anammoxibacter sp.]
MNTEHLVCFRQCVWAYLNSKGSHRNFVHPKVTKPIAISGKAGDDALDYQEKST